MLAPSEFLNMDPLLAGEVAAWVIAVVLILITSWQARSARVGLALAYALNLVVVHFFGAMIYLAPWFGNVHKAAVTVEGFTESTFWIVGFALGAVFLAPWVGRKLAINRNLGRAGGERLPAHFAWTYLSIGLVCYFVLQPLLFRIPSVFAVASVGWNFLAVGLAVGCCQACRERRRASLVLWLLGAACLPFLTVTTQGFIGFGTAAALSVAALVAIWYRPRWQVVLGGLLVAYVGLSLYVTYFRDRNTIRDIVSMGGDAQQRTSQVLQTVSNFSWFDPTNPEHLTFVDVRLNQNLLVGAAVDYMEAGNEPYALGETFWQATEALVPRILWPDKPVSAGSGRLVTRFTGIQYGDTTAVGIGHVLEFYANFGTPGVVLGALLMGVLVGIVDDAAGRRLIRGDGFGLARWYLPGFSLLFVGGSLVELTGGVATAIIAVFVSERLLRFLTSIRQRRDEASRSEPTAVMHSQP